MQSWRAGLLFLLAATAAVNAQERRASLVIVRDAQGAAVEGAEVVCFARPYLFDLEGEPDLVRGVTGAGGRVVVELLPMRRYALFASIVDGDHDHFRASEVRDGLIAGAEKLLTLGEPTPQRSVRVNGDAAWFQEGPLKVQVSPVGGGQFFLDVGADGALPPMPTIASFRVLDANGAPLREGSPWKWVWGNFAEGQGERPDYDVLLPLPTIVTMHVVDEAGKPVFDAELWQKVPAEVREHADARVPPTRGSWRYLGCSGQDGRLSARLMVHVRDGHLSDEVLIEARAKGYATARSGVQTPGQIVCNGVPKPATNDGVLPFVMRAPQKLIIEPAAAYEVELAGKLPEIAPDEHPVRLRTGDDGVAPLPLVRSRHAKRVARIHGADGDPVWAIVEQHGQGRVSLDPRNVNLRVLDRNGAPARDAAASVTWTPRRGRAFEIPLVVDAQGRLRERLNHGTWFLWVRAGDDVGWRVVDEGEKDIEEELRLAPIRSARIRLVDGEKRPVVGERCSCRATTMWGRRDRAPLTRFLRRMQQDLTWDLRGVQFSDSDGMLHFPVLPIPEMTLDVEVLTGNGIWGGMVAVPVSVDEVTELRVR